MSAIRLDQGINAGSGLPVIGVFATGDPRIDQ